MPHRTPFVTAAAAALVLLLPVANAGLLGGYGNAVDDPMCAYACDYAVPSTLDCPEFANMTAEEKAAAYPSTECFATNIPYLTSIAWCIHERCDASVKTSLIDKFWEDDLIYGLAEAGLTVKYNYGEAMALINPKHPPAELSPDETTLNRTIAIPDDLYDSYMRAVVSSKHITEAESSFMIMVFLAGALVPFTMSLLRLLPFPARWVSLFHAYLIDPPVFGKHHSVAVLGLGFIPTRGQAIFIVWLFAVNAVANFANYDLQSPNAFYPDVVYAMTRHIANRSGALAITNVPLVFLFAGRNNMLMWLTDWSHSTFLLVHRWIAFICTMQACLHSAMWLQIMVKEKTYTTASHEPYWYWGIIGTLALSLFMPLSLLPLRKWSYEIFLVGHIILAILVIVGLWYHINDLYGSDGGYIIFIFLTIGLWVFDRFLRWVRIAARGVKRAHVTAVDDEYIRIDIPGVDVQGYCYAYFPTVSWKMWENHPFSVVGCNSGVDRSGISRTPSSHSPSDTEVPSSSSSPQMATDSGFKAKEAGFTSRTRAIATPNQQHGITLFIRPHSGLTRLLAARAGGASIPVLIEATYGHEGKTFLQGNETRFAPTPEYPNLLCIAGGVGITAVLPALNASLSLYDPMGTTKLYWGLRNRSLVDSLEGMITNSATGEKGNWGHIEPHITVGSRINVRQILEDELGESGRAGTTVVVCGPLAMCDEVRYTVAAMARHGKVLRFLEESCTW
ncbi:hypothetical protein G7046_g4986 [Stylonectria norvegica]|nr:hypothetical protein G7046_g4986 [Stylonectria norvegica]